MRAGFFWDAEGTAPKRICAGAASVLLSLASGASAYAEEAPSAPATAGSTSRTPAPMPDEASISEAERSFLQGVESFGQEHFAEGCQYFAQSEARYHSGATLLYLGGCFENGYLPGGLLAALDAFEAASVDALSLDSDEGVSLREESQRRARAVRTRLAHLELDPTPRFAGQVLINGEPIVDLGRPLSMNPGRYHLELRAPGKKTHSEDFELAEGRELRIRLLELEADPPAAPPFRDAPRRAEGEANRAEAPADAAAGHSRFGSLPFLLAGAGVVAGGAWIYTGLTSIQKDSEYSRGLDRCSALTCTQSQLTHLSAVHRQAQAYAVATDYAAIPAFTLSMGAALLLWWLGASDQGSPGEAASARASVQAACSTHGCWLETGVRF